jgi:hypothetical protein
MKGKDYSKLKQWYKLLNKKVSDYLDLCERHKDEPGILTMGLNIIKCGLYSHNYIVSELCCTLIENLWSEL